MKISKEKKIMFYSLLFINILMLVYYFSLAYLNRFSQDDYLFYSGVKESGILSFIKTTYLTHSGRYSYYFHEACLFFLFTKSMPLFINQLVVYLFSVMVVFYLLKRYFSASFFILNVAAFIVHTFIFINFDFSAFYWSCATVYYLMALVPVILYLLITNKQKGFLAYALLVLVSVWVGGISEALVPVCLVLLFVYFLYLLYQHQFSFIRTLALTETKKLIIVSVILFIGFLIIYFAPGNQVRMQEFEQATTVFSLLFVSAHSVLLYFYLLFFKLPYIFPLMGIFFYLGNISNKESFPIVSVRQLLLSVVVFVLFVCLNVFPTAYAVSGFGFHRVYSHTIFLSVLYILFLCFFIGRILQSKKQKLFLFGSVFLILAFSVSLIFHLFTDIPTAIKYRDAVDARVAFLLNKNQQGETKIVECYPLPKPTTTSFKHSTFKLLKKEKNPIPVLYYPNEISTDTLGYVNQTIKQFYNLKFNIKLKASNCCVEINEE